MASNEIILRVRTEGGKQILELADNTRRVRTEADKASVAQTRLGQAAEKAGRGGSSVNHAKNARDMKLLREEIGSGNNGLVGAYATLAVNTFAVVAAFTALQKATGALKIMAGLEAQGGRLGRTLSITAGNIREITDNAISMADAMRSTAQLTAGGFGQEQIQELTLVAKNASGALGRDLADSMDRLSRGVTKLEPELLDELGIMTKLDEASTAYAVANNKSAASLTSVEKRQAFMNAVLAEGDRKFRGIGDSVSEYDAYTRLAASATDIFNSAIGTLAMAFAPIVELFAANKGLIVGALLLYAATIRKDLIPALTEAAARQQELVAAKGSGLAANAKKFAEQAQAMEDAQRLNGATTGRFLPRAGAKELAALASAAEAGTVNLADFRRAHVALTAQIENADDILRRAAADTEDYQIALANKGVLRDAQREVRGLTAAYYEQQAAQKAGNVLNTAQEAQLGNLRESFRSMGADLRGQFNDLQNASRPLDQATTRLGTVQQALGGAAMTVGNGLTVAATGAKAFGIMALNALPVIGQIVMAITLLSAAYEYLKDLLTTDEQKRFNKVQEEYNTIITASAEKQRNFNMLMGQVQSSAKAQTDALMLTGNTVTEVTQKFLELAKARKEAGESSIFDGTTSKVGGSEELADIRNGFRFEGVGTEATARAKEYREGIDALGVSISVLEPAQRKLIIARAQEINQIEDLDKRNASLITFIKQVNEQYGTLTTSVQNVAETYKNLEEATTKFIQAANISTPVDNLVETLNKAVTSTAELSLELKRGSIEADAFGRALAGNLGAQSRNLLGADIAKVIDLDTMQAEIKTLQDLGDKQTLQDRQRLAHLQSEETLLTQAIGPAIQRRLQQTQQLTRQAQIDYRLAKDVASLEEARYNRSKDLFQVGAQGYLAQQEHEEKMRAAQVSQLDIQQAILQVMQTQIQATIQTLELRKAEYQDRFNQLKLEKEINKEVLSTYRLQTRTATEADLKPDVVAKAQEMRRLEANIDQIVISIGSARKGMDELDDSIESLETQKAAILAQNLTNAEKAARAAGAEFEVSKKFFEQVKNYAEAIFQTNKGIRDYNRLISGQSNTIRDQLGDIVETYEATRKNLLDELAVKAAQLNVDMKILQTNQDSVSLTEQGVRAATEAKEVAQGEYKNEVLRTEELLRQADVQMRLQALQLAIFDTRKEGVEWQRQGYEWAAKESAILAENVEKGNRLAAMRRQNSRLARGLPDTEQNTRNEAIRSAADALQAAKTAYKFRVEGINAEYALLEAQKVMLEQELISRRRILELQEGISADYLAPLDRAIDQLSQIDTGSMRKSAIAGEQLTIATLEEALRGAILSANPRSDTYAGRGAAMREDRAALKDALISAQSAQDSPLQQASKLIISQNNSGIKALGDSVAKPMTTLLSTTETMAADVSAIRAAVTGGGAGGSLPGSAPAIAKEMLVYLKSRGVSDNHALGMLANIKAESSFNPGADIIDSNGLRSSGLFQHNGARGNAMRAFAGSDWAKDWKSQIEYALSEADTKKYLTISFPSAQDASRWFTENWERPANKVQKGIERAAWLGSVVSPTAAGNQARAESTTGRMSVDTQPYRDALEKRNPSTSGVFVAAMDAMPLTESAQQVEILAEALPRLEATYNASFQRMAEGTRTFGEDFDFAMEPLRKLAESLGPEGELILAITNGISGITSSLTETFETLSTSTLGSTEGITAMLGVAQQAVSTISGILAAASQRKIANIDAEIAAEQKRDGQSAASQQKIAELEKKKDNIARKQFNTNKKLMMASAVIATATGITQALALPFPMNLIMAGVIGAMGAAQLAIIASTNYQSASSTANSGKVSVPRLTIGRVGDKVNLDRNNVNAGGEIGYLRGQAGYGSNASNYMTVGSAYGGSTDRGYGHRAFLVGEKGPEFLETSEPMNVRPRTEQPVKEGDNYYIQATDADSFINMLENNPEAMARGLRRLANSNGERFMENVDLKGVRATKR